VNTFKHTLRGGIIFFLLFISVSREEAEEKYQGKDGISRKKCACPKFREKRCEVERSERTLALVQANADLCAERGVMCLSSNAQDEILRSERHAVIRWVIGAQIIPSLAARKSSRLR